MERGEGSRSADRTMNDEVEQIALSDPACGRPEVESLRDSAGMGIDNGPSKER